MRLKLTLQQITVIACLLIFLLGKLAGIHAHGHVDIGHQHDEEFSISHSHSSMTDKTHLVTHINDSHDMVNGHGDHGEKTFEIDSSAIVKAKASKLGQILLLFFLPLCLLLFTHQPKTTYLRRRDTAITLSSTPDFCRPLLRAPPSLA